MATNVAPPPALLPRGLPPSETDPGRRFGLPTASALVVGSVIGLGAFALPSALAVYEPISLVAFGDVAGFLNTWSYWITAWAGNAAIVVAWVGYLEAFWNPDLEPAR